MRGLVISQRKRKSQPLDLGRVGFVCAMSFGNGPVDGAFKMLACAARRRSFLVQIGISTCLISASPMSAIGRCPMTGLTYVSSRALI